MSKLFVWQVNGLRDINSFFFNRRRGTCPVSIVVAPFLLRPDPRQDILSEFRIITHTFLTSSATQSHS